MSEKPTSVPLLARLNDGRELPIYPCNCGRCGNEWFVPGLSEEWDPSFCPFCGLKFLRKTIGEDEHPDDFKPYWDADAGMNDPFEDL